MLTSGIPDVYPSKFDAEHIARHDPARVLADVAAKRAILDLHRPRVPYGYGHSLDEMLADGSAACSVCGDQGVDITTVYHPCDTLLVLARVWAEHPDFAPAWRP